MAAYRPQRGEIAGVDLVGYRLELGSIQLGADRGRGPILPDFPDEVEVCGAVYTLEEKKRQERPDGMSEAKWKDHPGRTLEWGIYV